MLLTLFVIIIFSAEDLHNGKQKIFDLQCSSPEKVKCSSFSSHNDVDKFLTLQFYRKLFPLMRHISHAIRDVSEYDIPAL